MPIVNRTDLYRLIDELPESVLPEVAEFLESVRSNRERQTNASTPYVPIALGGVWKGLTITDEDIAAVRQDMWRDFGEANE